MTIVHAPTSPFLSSPTQIYTSKQEQVWFAVYCVEANL